jgi:hypothetical protein
MGSSSLCVFGVRHAPLARPQRAMLRGYTRERSLLHFCCTAGARGDHVGCGEAVGRSLFEPLRQCKHHHCIRAVNHRPRNPPVRARTPMGSSSLCVFGVRHAPLARPQRAMLRGYTRERSLLHFCCKAGARGVHVGCGEAVGRSLFEPLRPCKHHYCIRAVNHRPRNPPVRARTPMGSSSVCDFGVRHAPLARPQRAMLRGYTRERSLLHFCCTAGVRGDYVRWVSRSVVNRAFGMMLVRLLQRFTTSEADRFTAPYVPSNVSISMNPLG